MLLLDDPSCDFWVILSHFPSCTVSLLLDILVWSQKKRCSMRNGQSDVALVICDFQLSSSDHSPIFHSLLHAVLDVTGDDYPMAETMVVDGLGTIFGACFGSFYSTTVYIGHPIHKSLGAKRGFSLFNGIIYFVLYLS